MLLNCSHLVVATENVPRIMNFIKEVFQIEAHFENDMFGETVLPSGFRIAFFKPVGESAKRFDAKASREALSVGLTVSNVKHFYSEQIDRIEQLGGSVSGEPKDHPWGEASFLLIDPDGNRWEVTQSPTDSGVLVNRE